MTLFRKTQKASPPQTPTEYPLGSFIKTEKGTFYIVGTHKRYRIISERCLASWSPQRVIETSEAAVVNYRITAKMKFRNGSLIHSLTDGRIYLIVQGKRHALVSPEAFERIGSSVNTREYVTVSKTELELHELGEDIS